MINMETEDLSFRIEYDDFSAVYSVTKNPKDGLPAYGIKVECGFKNSDCLENIFFTAEEAFERCKWLGENQVFTQGFRDVMADIMQ